jgi:hypothetical protein
MPIDLHAHVSVEVPAQLARAHPVGMNQTVPSTTRVHPEASSTWHRVERRPDEDETQSTCAVGCVATLFEVQA